jgi:ankyrin repeat protein
MVHQLAREGTFSQVEEFLRQHPIISKVDLGNALSAAALRGDLRIVTLLLDYGAEPNGRPTEHLPAIHCAVEGQHEKIVDLLAQRGADVNLPTENGFTPLHLAVDIEGDSAWQRGITPSGELTALLLQLGANPGVMDAQGRTPLSIAEQYQHARAIQLLQPDTGKEKMYQ